MFRRAHVAVATYLVAALALIPALATIDGALEAHRWCAEHDALEHHDPGAGAADADEAPAHRAAVSSTEESDRHETCQFASLFREDEAPPAPAFAVSQPPANQAIVCAEAGATIPAPIALLHAAPKLPPPPSV